MNFRKSIYTTLFIFSLSISQIFAAIQAVVFDLNGVCFKTHTKSIVFNHLGLKRLLMYGAYMRQPTQVQKILKERFFAVLETIEPYTSEQDRAAAPRDEKGNVLPLLMRAWLDGSQSGTTVLNKILGTCKNNPELFTCYSEQILVARLAHSLFIPTNYIHCQEFLPEALTTMFKLKQQGYKIYILSNWDAHSFTLMKEKHKAFFDLFDGIVVSGEAQLSKPDASIYQHLLTTYQLKPDECIFVDDQEINVTVAQQLGLHGVICPQKKGVFSLHPDLTLAYTKIEQVINEQKNIRA